MKELFEHRIKALISVGRFLFEIYLKITKILQHLQSDNTIMYLLKQVKNF